MDRRTGWAQATLAALAATAVTSLRLKAAKATKPTTPTPGGEPQRGSGTPERPYRSSTFWRVFDAVARRVDGAVGWPRLPLPLALPVLIGVRNRLRKRNLYDTTREPGTPPEAAPYDERLRAERSADGSWNDLDEPSMGMARTRFGRNVPIDCTYPADEATLMRPSPRTVSRELLTRETFVPATSVNALTAAWLQFMIRDWFSHGKSVEENPFEPPLAADDPWPEKPLRILRTRPDETRAAGATTPPTYINTESHWWDGSQLYGTTREAQLRVRSGHDGKLRVTPDGLPEMSSDPDQNPAAHPGFWLGLAMMGAIFTLEHNAICDRLRSEHPTWSDEDLFQRARLVNAALLAKIHTVEWTPAVISHPTTVTALRANWWGLAGERVARRFGRISGSEVVSGIPGSKADHYGVPYALTEEFVAVYRMHPLVPDDYSFRAAADDALIEEVGFREIAGPKAIDHLGRVSMTDSLYSFGTSHPGLVVLHNFPRFLQEFERPDGKLMDLAATDIMRSRELGVPRYNAFRKLLHLAPARSFEDLTANPAWAEELRRVYDDVDDVDLTVGMYAEPLPKGFAFSDTAFRIFVLMASRRLNSDRFFTDFYNADTYTQAGLDWIADNDMAAVLRRHYPALAPFLGQVKNAFAPWPRATA